MKKIFLLLLPCLAFLLGKYSERPKVVLPSANEGGGMFFNVVNVLSFLRHCEKNHLSSFEVDFGTDGLYYESDLGPNWWNYFFEPVNQSGLGAKLSKPRKMTQRHIAYFNYDGEYYLPRKKAHELIQKYIRVRPEIAQEIDSFEKEYFEGVYVIGIHYRGTDKSVEAPEVAYSEVRTEVDKALISHPQAKIFVATDTQPFFEYMERIYPGRVLSADAERSADGKPLHYGREGSTYQRGKEAIIDALLLSRCELLIRTSSTQSLCSTYFSPDLPVIELSQKLPMERQVN